MGRHELKPGEVHYPETDGKPTAETDRHRDLMVDLIAAARNHFRDAPGVYVSGNLLVYWVEGDPTKSVAPDFFAVRGVSKEPRRTYKVWEEGKGPEIVIELTSRKTHREDLVEKRSIYEELGVLEYFLFDPDGVRFQPPFRGLRLASGAYEPVAATPGADGALVLESQVLGLELRVLGPALRLVDPGSGRKLPVYEDLVALVEGERLRVRDAEHRAEAAERQADQTRRQAQQAERRAAELEREVERLRRELGRP